jgi:ketosteroid isomerase-like protein
VTATAKEIFERYIWAGALTRNPDALAETFTEDGVYEAPLVPPGHVFPRRLAGRDEIRSGMAAFYARPTVDRPVNTEKTRYVLHTTADPDLFIAEIDSVFADDGDPPTMSLVQIFRVRDGRIALLRDYFAPDAVD